MKELFGRLRARVAAFDAPTLGYVVRLGLWLALFTLALEHGTPLVSDALKHGTAALTAALLSPFTDAVAQRGDVVSYAGFSVRIIEECFGLLEMAIFAAAVLAFRAPWRARWLGLAAGLPVIYAFNLLRIAMLLAVGRHAPSLFEFAHLYFWQATLIAMITGLWLLWVRLAVRA